ncbi:methylated-DNA--protein-cysteine S-methyltransferase, partial [gut metagenome]
SPVIEWAQVQLGDYFSGKRNSFELPLYLFGTDFQLSVWNELLQIPYGNTISYAELARRIGRPTAIRAVANANNANPLSVFIPCHRVIGSNRELVGYGGGLSVKEKLLCLENGICLLREEKNNRAIRLRR